MAKIIQLIYTEEKVGTGKEGDPIRLCPELWTTSGKLVARRDSEIDFNMFFSENLE
jgi:hypothetical protein